MCPSTWYGNNSLYSLLKKFCPTPKLKKNLKVRTKLTQLKKLSVKLK